MLYELHIHCTLNQFSDVTVCIKISNTKLIPLAQDVKLPPLEEQQSQQVWRETTTACAKRQ